MVGSGCYCVWKANRRDWPSCEDLKKARCTNKLHVWVADELTRKILLDPTSSYESLLNHINIDPFPQWIVTGEEKRITYSNVKWKRSRSKGRGPKHRVYKPKLAFRYVFLYLVVWAKKHLLWALSLRPYSNSDLHRQHLHPLKRKSPRSAHLWPIGGELYFIMTTPDHTHRYWLAKHTECSVGRFLCMHLVEQTSCRVWQMIWLVQH